MLTNKEVLYMNVRLSLKARKELLASIRVPYQHANREEKIKILDGLIAATGYKRKHAIAMLNNSNETPARASRLASNRYNEAVHEALLILWHCANRICSKRLVPFIPELINALERHGHLSLSQEVRTKLLTISPATVDRLLKLERQDKKKGVCATRSGSLLKKQIPIRTFSDWNEIIPGFMEGDLVAHCGDTVSGSFLNTLVLTDIVTGWTEFMPLLCKTEANVLEALQIVQEILPFPILGIDTDNGSEFINYGLLEFCNKQHITFTRSRAYRKNDQAHVEEKNGSIVRRLIGYDRYEGVTAWHTLTELYSVIRLYVNYFQPSLKLIYKNREGAKVVKQYDKAKTPYQRLTDCTSLTKEDRDKLVEQYNILDPLKLLREIQQKQEELWKYAWKCAEDTSQTIVATDDLAKMEATTIGHLDKEKSSNLVTLEHYRSIKKPREVLGPRTWRTRKDPFENSWEILLTQLKINPGLTSKDLLEELIQREPGVYGMKLLRTLQRRISTWRKEQLQFAKDHQLKLITGSKM